jgi:hypothetical protein
MCYLSINLDFTVILDWQFSITLLVKSIALPSLRLLEIFMRDFSS